MPSAMGSFQDRPLVVWRACRCEGNRVIANPENYSAPQEPRRKLPSASYRQCLSIRGANFLESAHYYYRLPNLGRVDALYRRSSIFFLFINFFLCHITPLLQFLQTAEAQQLSMDVDMDGAVPIAAPAGTAMNGAT